MSKRTLDMDDRLYQYLLRHSVRERELLRRLRQETDGTGAANMQIAPEQGQFMALLVELIGARRIIEVGTFTGYSSLCLAGALPDDGELICCDIDEEWTSIARRYWHEAGYDNRITLKLAPALQTLNELISGGQSGQFDLIFIDADKESYPAYYERSLLLIRTGGLLLFDNTLWGGAVADPADQSVDTRALRELNEQLLSDERVSISLLPLADGLTLARKR